MRLVEVRHPPQFDIRLLGELRERVSASRDDIAWNFVVSPAADAGRSAYERWAARIAGLERMLGRLGRRETPVEPLESGQYDLAPTLVLTFSGSSSNLATAPCVEIRVIWAGSGGESSVGLQAVHEGAPTCEMWVSVHAAGGALVEGVRLAVPTQLSFAATHDLAFSKAIAYAAKYASRVLAGEKPALPDGAALAKSAGSPAPDRPPSLLRYSGRMLVRATRKIASRMQGRDWVWHLRLSRGGWQDHLKDNGRKIDNPPGRYWADPFVWHRDGRDCMFVEEFDAERGLAHIAALEIDPEGRVRSLGTAIREDFHLSFPFPFEYQGQLYMCPESSAAREIRIYRCEEFPLRWRLEKVLMRGISAADTLLIESGDRWWMLTNVDSSGGGDHCTELHAYWADSPTSTNWTPHAGNPLICDAERSRNGGFLHEGAGRFRVNQIQRYAVYGAGLEVNRIDQLTPGSFAETPVARALPDAGSAPVVGTHHLSSNGRWTVSDHLEYTRLKRQASAHVVRLIGAMVLLPGYPQLHASLTALA